MKGISKFKVLVTGGAGFIGSHVVDRFVQEGCHVKILDNLSTGSLDNLSAHIGSSQVDLVEGDIRDRQTVMNCLEGVDVVVHLAALVSVPLSIQNPDSNFDINVQGTLNMLKLSAAARVKRFVFISSCAVCGDSKVLPVTEQTLPNPLSPYAESKLIGERLCLGFSQRQLFQSVVLRFFNVYGPRQRGSDYSGVITLFIQGCRQKKPLTIYGDGNQTRDFVYVTDVAEAVFAAAKSDLDCDIINVGSGKPTSVNELAETVLKLMDEKVAINHVAPRVGDIRDSYADISKAKKLLGYEPKVGLRDGLERLIAVSNTKN
jgi:nucleoside-diphosphate-sugar epimerase